MGSWLLRRIHAMLCVCAARQWRVDATRTVGTVTLHARIGSD